MSYTDKEMQVSTQIAYMNITQDQINGYLKDHNGEYPTIQEIPVDISLILGNLITVIVDYQIPHKPLKILSL